MAKRSVPGPVQGSVQVVGARPTVSLTARAAPVADLLVTLTGGSPRVPVPITFSVALNLPVSGRARLIDESTKEILAESIRSGGGYVFKNVPVTMGDRAARRFRITNLRGNASGAVSGSSAGTTPVVAFVAATGPFRIPLSGSQQNVATLERGRRRDS